VSVVPLELFVVAVSCTVWPTGTLALGGDTVTEPTASAVTVAVAVPLFPSLVAVIVAVPGPVPVTRPVEFTVAIASLLDDHVTTRFVTVVPFRSFTVVVNWTLCPTNSGFVDGATVTLPTGTGTTVTVDVPLLPSLVAVIVAVPSATAVTTPLAETLAMLFALVLQLTGRSVTTVPLRSFTVAVS
jgi:hypothetical protein